MLLSCFELDNKIISLESYLSNIFEASYLHQIITENYSDDYLKGSTDKLFGLPPESSEIIHQPSLYSLDEELQKVAKQTFMNTFICNACLTLYEYAVNGIPTSEHWSDIVEDVNIYLQHIHSDFSPISPNTRVIVDLALLRFGIDGEQDSNHFICDLDKFKVIALMADLDERTVKNAHSQGFFNGDSGDFDFNAIKLWLSTKRGFIPTKGLIKKNSQSLNEVKTAPEFGYFLKEKRESLGALFDLKVFQTKHYLFDKKTVVELENGFFDLPLNTVSILANAYYIDENEFLNCVMRVFFSSELEKIRGMKDA
ncbi:MULTISPECIES: hypothetical protein [unclassified Acinetobacter]|uniref:hypothetical protein n=1 Tax=unclassified Acinetobacter TaxID=196816 RepID=UPI001205464F|nr:MULTISPECIES: hypothetical protein [unclassified Acinetobacter]RZJ22859.1 MAG: hypothetical protein EON51_05475 [Acinetobacter sp.]